LGRVKVEAVWEAGVEEVVAAEAVAEAEAGEVGEIRRRETMIIVLAAEVVAAQVGAGAEESGKGGEAVEVVWKIPAQ
jgi:hypothetical protein